MRRLFCFAFLAAALGFAATAYLDTPADPPASASTTWRSPDVTAAPAASTPAAPAAASPTTPPRTVTAPAAPLSPAGISSEQRITSSKPADAESRRELTRNMQRELKRVGCYGGEITGYWSASTRRAMTAFVDWINASLPVDEPDYILLALLQAHPAVACGSSCPKGQSLSNGRCIPNAVLAQSGKKDGKQAQRTRTDSKLAAAPANTNGKRVVEKPAGEAAQPPAPDGRLAEQAAAPPAESAGKETAPTNAPAAAAPQKPAPAPLPGRMAMGGPKLGEPEAALVPGRAPDGNLADLATDKPAAEQADTNLPENRAATAPPEPAAVAPKKAPRSPRASQRPARFSPPSYVIGPSYGSPYGPPSYGPPPSKPSRVSQRQMIYNLFERPDRSGN